MEPLSSSQPINPQEYYEVRIAECNSGIARLEKALRWYPYFRVSLFVALIIDFYFFITATQWLNGSLFFLLLILFASASARSILLKKKIALLKLDIQIYTAELKYLKYDYSAFEDAAEFTDTDHPYTHDLDIFGKDSLFKSINRTSTIYGKSRLAKFLGDAYHYSDSMELRQAAIKELAMNKAYRHQFRKLFLENKTGASDLDELSQMMQEEALISKINLIRILLYIASGLTLLTIPAAAFGLIPFTVPIVAVLLQFAVVGRFGKKTMKAHHRLTHLHEVTDKYAKALLHTESMHFESELLRSLQAEIKHDAGSQPSEILKQLANLLHRMDSNLNVLVSVFLNGLFMYNIHILIGIERWKQAYGPLIPKWFDALSSLEALCSLGTFAFNHPGYNYPVREGSEFCFIAEEMGHPLIPETLCVKNDISIQGSNHFVIVTGANMSGKSTFLRTIGVNAILAQTGAPVFARSLRFYPVALHSSIRTSDSLAKRESYFFAELKRLKQIIDGLEAGEQKFILLDEILKGTNSKDKQTGSIALIRQLLKYQTSGIFATHDLILGSLVDTYPDHITNMCFEIHINGDQMEIPYKIAKGICQNLNATYLMKNMGILIDPA